MAATELSSWLLPETSTDSFYRWQLYLVRKVLKAAVEIYDQPLMTAITLHMSVSPEIGVEFVNGIAVELVDDVHWLEAEVCGQAIYIISATKHLCAAVQARCASTGNCQAKTAFLLNVRMIHSAFETYKSF